MGEGAPVIRPVTYVMAEDEVGRRAALDELLPLQQSDFEGLFEAMVGWPVTIRLLDPPLHEFLPDRFELHEEIVRARIDRSPRLEGLEGQFERVRSLEETNPMVGTRGVRLGVMHPEIYEMQVRAIARAARAVQGAHRPSAWARDHDPAGRLRARARARTRPRADRGRKRRASPTAPTSVSGR